MIIDNKHFILAKRYIIHLENGGFVPLDLKPEKCIFFSMQEEAYIINAIRGQDIDVNKIDHIETIFVPVATEQTVNVIIGV